MSSERPSLSVFFPCHNEEGNVEDVTRRAVAACREHTSDFEVIIVDDGSTDNTPHIAQRLANEIEEVRTVRNDPNLGYGGALQRGFREARKDWIFYTDGDGQFDIAEISKVLPLRADNVIVSAYRIQRQDSAIRKLNAWCWTRLVCTLFSLRIRDIDCAFKLYPSNFFKRIELRSMGALIDTEILAKACRLGYIVKQVGVQHYPRLAGEQSGANLSVIMKAFRELLTLRKHITESIPRDAC